MHKPRTLKNVLYIHYTYYSIAHILKIDTNAYTVYVYKQNAHTVHKHCTCTSKYNNNIQPFSEKALTRCVGPNRVILEI